MADTFDPFDIKARRDASEFKQLQAIADIRAMVEPIPGKAMLPELVEAIRGIVEERDRLRGVLQRIADQHTTDEIDSVTRYYADFEGAYDIIIKRARKALNGGDNE